MDNRSNILSKALELFSARGYEGVGVQEIVDAANITKPTMYHYFGNKEGLLKEIFVERFTPFVEKLRVVSRYQGDLPLSLDRVVETYFEFARNEKDFYRLLLALMYGPPDSQALGIAFSFAEEPFRLLENMFTRAAEDHGNMRGRHQMYALTLIGMINNYVTLFLNGYVEITEGLRRQVLRQYMYGIYS
jgi:AcrR family transcriptional regulator